MLGLAVAIFLASLVPCVASHLPSYRESHSDTSTPISIMAPDTVNPTPLPPPLPQTKKSPPPPLKPVVNITVIFEEQDLDDFLPIFERALADYLNESVTFMWTGHALSASPDFKTMVTKICAHFQGDRSHVRLLIVFGRVQTIQTVNVLSEALGIPVIGYMLDKGDGYVQVHNPLFLSLQPSNKNLARGLVSLLSVNFWYRLTMITQVELRHDGFHRTFRELTQPGKWSIEGEIFLSRSASDDELVASLSSIRTNSSGIIILHATASLASRIFIMARKGLPIHKRFAWIITENAYTRSEDILQDFPFGTKAFLVNHDVKAEELLRDVLDFVIETIQGDGRGHSALLSRLKASSSPYPPLSLSSVSSSIKARGCWSARPKTIHPNKDALYSALLSTSIYGLTGQITFDEDGFMNVSKFRVRNLVYDGRQSVWQDIGCVQGKEVRPFGIIWPGDAQSLKADTEGKKRYTVVTNPVQPFVITEAPHSDYADCLSDTPCLNLTNKYKSKDVVMKAIRAYEEGEGSESGLFTVQCCRGLTIDLLNKLSLDLEFEFTLYIVQDETYGQKTPNGTWTGMMRDLIDDTAHFAVAAFSITSQREAAIDFTDPYFFSGFSILYSDRTRETSMLAFLEPFSTRVWFAILVSAQITAVCMALLEWNSPFGLNPWGRKRTKNYSLASGLTMVFSVLFGHTVRTKSPKAWPSKFLQNIWAFGAIFIIASYTANLAAFIAGKHAGINYIDSQDTRLQDIRIGVLPGSAVHEWLKNAGSKLVMVADRYPVPKTDEGIDWVIKGKLDALLGDYPILDYARAHLAPSCELKLISKLFGNDRYGLGLPKQSPLKAALSRRISEYHSMGGIDDLIDIHFADAHCFKKRISEEDSQLEVTHHAGLFVMLCVGFCVGVLVLLLEYLLFKFLVPYIRQCPEDSRWKSVHLMFVSQRLQRIITSSELISPRHSAKEMLGIFKKREFARLFQKSTIRRNRLADIAKTKRINRNFYDIVEKAKWLHEMKESGLMDDDTPSTPTIIEIPLKHLSVNIELGTSTLKLDHRGDYTRNDCKTESAARAIAMDVDDQDISSSDDASSPESDDSLLGASRTPSEKSLPNLYKTSSPVLPISTLTASPRAAARRLHRPPKTQPKRQGRRTTHRQDMSSSPELVMSPNSAFSDPSSSTSRLRSLSMDHSSSPVLALESSPNNTRQRLSSGSSLPSSSVINELSPRRKPKRLIPHATSGRVRFLDSLPNGNIVRRSAQQEADKYTNDNDANMDLHDENVLCEEQTPTVLGEHSNLLKTLADESHMIAGAGASASTFPNKVLLPKTSNISLARCLLHKTRSYQDHLCSAADSAQAEPSIGHFCLDSVSKEELLVLWKSSEIELNKRLQVALQDKARLERKLALLQKHSPV